VGRELVLPTAIALGGLTVVALVKNVLSYADWILNRGLGPESVAWIALYQAVPLTTQTLPFALLIGSLVGLGRLKDDRELQAIEFCGVAPSRLVGPVLILAVWVAALGLMLSHGAAPWARGRLDVALERMAFESPGALLRAGRVHEFGDRQLLAREVSSRGDRLRGVLLWVPDVGETIFSESAVVEPLGERTIGVTLHDARILSSPQEGASQLSISRFRTELTEPYRPVSEAEPDRLESASLARLEDLARQPHVDLSRARRAEAEIQRRFALPAACLLFGLVAVPIAVAGRNFSRSKGAVVGLLVTVAYYGLVQLGNGLLGYEGIPVEVAVWLPNVLGVAVASWLLRPGGIRTTEPSLAPAPRRASRSTEAGGRAAIRNSRWRRRPLDRYVLVTFIELVLLSFAALLVAYLIPCSRRGSSP
jgi:lipopolysaccharide export system permease protein